MRTPLMPAALHSAGHGRLRSTRWCHLYPETRTRSRRRRARRRRREGSGNHLPRRCRQWHAMFRLLLGRCSGLRPDASLEVEVRPSRRDYLSAARACKQQQPNGVGRLLVRKFIERRSKTHELVRGQVASALTLLVALDAAAWVVHPPAPANSKREHLRQQRKYAVGAYGGPL